MGKFCEPIYLDLEERKKLLEAFNDYPKIVSHFNCQGECVTYQDGIPISKQKKDGTVIYYKNKLE